MATLDVILNNGGNSDEAPVVVADGGGDGGNAPVTTTPPATTTTDNNDGGTGGYEALLKKLNPYTPPTEEELKKERKKQKRDQIFAAIGDGISALSNLFFTTQYAPNMYTGKNTMSEKTKIRYDKLKSDRETKNAAYFNSLMKARQADDDAAHRERTWQRQLGLDQKEQERYDANIEHRDAREKIADDRYAAEQEYKKDRDKVADEQWQKSFDEGKRRSDRDYNFSVKQHNDNVTLRRETNNATAARGVRGKQLGFADGNGNQVSIYENVWKGSMQSVYDATIQDLAPTDERERKRFERQIKDFTPSQKEDYVKQNWHKSQKASQIMMALSKLDPATMTSELNGGGLGWGSDSDNETDW